MSRRADVFRVTVVPPRKGEGPCWYWRIKPPHGRGGETRRSSKTEDRASAEEGARRVAERLNRGLVRPGGDPTVLEVLDRFVAARELAKTPRGTLKTFKLARRWIAAHMGTLPASKLSSGSVLAMRDAMEAKHAASTCNLYVGVLRRAWRWAKARELVAAPFPEVEELDETPTPKRPLLPEEVAAILRELETFSGGKWLPLFRVLAESGHRVGAILAARGRDLRDDPEQPWIEVTDQKSRARRRAFVLPETVALLPRRRPDELIFQAKHGGPIPVSTPNWAFHRALKLAGLEHLKGEVDVHSFRRFVVDQNCQDGESIARGMRITGHENPDIFLAYQKNARDNPHDALRRIRERVDAALPTPGTTPGADLHPDATSQESDPSRLGSGSFRYSRWHLPHRSNLSSFHTSSSSSWAVFLPTARARRSSSAETSAFAMVSRSSSSGS